MFKADFSNTVVVPFNFLNLELHEECSRTLGMGWNLPEPAELGSSSRSGHNRGVAVLVEADAIGGGEAAAKTDAIREKLISTRLGSSS